MKEIRKILERAKHERIQKLFRFCEQWHLSHAWRIAGFVWNQGFQTIYLSAKLIAETQFIVIYFVAGFE